jgi:uncharacterized membrane protein
VRAARARAVVAALFLAAVAIRMAIPRGLWLDEAISAHQAHLGLPELIQDLAQGDRHPPLHHVLLWLVMRTIGDGDLAIRIPSIAAGALLVPAVYALAAELFDRRTGVVAALLTVLAPILVWYSQEARGYALEALFTSLAVLGCARILRRGRPGDFALHAVAAALAVWTHWFALLVVAATELVLFAEIIHRRRLGDPIRTFLRRWALASAALLCQLVPLGILAVAQVRATGTGGGYAGASSSGEGAVSFYAIVSNGAWALFGFHPDAVTEVLSAVWPLLMLATLLLIGRGVSRRAALLLTCTTVPLLALLVLGLRSPDVFDVRYFVAVVPIVLVLVARAARTWPRSPLGRTVATTAIAGVLAAALIDQQTNPDNPRRYDFREALAQVRAEARPGDVLLYQPPELRFVLDRYAPGLTARPLDGRLPTRDEARRVTVLTSFLDQERYKRVADRQLDALRTTRGPAGRDELPGVTLTRFR